MSMQRVAVIFDNRSRPETTGVYCRRALGQLVQVEHFLPTELSRIPRRGFDLYLNIDDGLEYRLPADLRPSAWWAIDTHMNLPWYKIKGPDFDLVCTAQRDGAEHLRQAGLASATWLPLACDPELHARHDVAKTFDICFIGTLVHGPRADLLDLLRRHFRNTYIGQCYFEEMARTYSASRIVFNRSVRNDLNFPGACSPMKILLTGAAGFIGFHTAQQLLARGDEVIGLDNFSPYYDPRLKEARAAILQRQRRFTLVRGSILERDTVRTCVQGVDRVCHLAAVAGVRHAVEHPEDYIDTNIRGFFHVIDEARRQQVPGFIYASSSSVYGSNEKLPFSEEDRTDRPSSLYAQTKKDNELVAHTYHHLYGMPVTGLRFFTVYGPWGRPDMALSLFTAAILHDRPIRLFGQGKMQRDFTYVEDIVAGILAALDRNYDEEVFNLGCGRREELLDFVQLVERCCGREARKEYLPLQPGDVPASLADISKARRMLSFTPQTTIREGVPRFVDWYQTHYDRSVPGPLIHCRPHCDRRDMRLPSCSQPHLPHIGN